MSGEFDLIARHLKPLAAGAPAALGLSDDAALMDPPEGERLVLAADALVEGIHFLPDDPPETVGRKLLRVNLSDLAAMGARPLGYLMTLALPPGDAERWLTGLAEGLAEDQSLFGLSVLGGDVTRTDGPASLSLTIIGGVPLDRALRRDAAEVGDSLFVSGSIGDAALGLAVLQGQLDAGSETVEEALVARYRLPEPRLSLGRALLERGLCRAAIDVSDGLLADAAHIAETSGLRLRIEADGVPHSSAAQAVLTNHPELAERLVTGGDDYELLFSVPSASIPAVEALAGELGVPVSCIGEAVAAEGEGEMATSLPPVELLDSQGRVRVLERGGWRHF